MPAFKIYHDPYVTCDEDRYLSQCAFDAAGILCQHRDIIKSLDNSKFKNNFQKDDCMFVIFFMQYIYIYMYDWSGITAKKTFIIVACHLT